MQTQVPSGALTPGTKLTVGSHQVTIKTYISEGGFAHVYVVYCNPVENGSEIACLKRVQVPDKVQLNLLRAEVDAMKRLKGHPNIVKYMDSHAARMPDGNGYEVLLLMEYCSGNGLIDFMNTRLREQLKEHEILKIMYDITYGLSSMHYLQPALLHRDLKIENVLIAADGTFKLCDFGSSSPVLRPPRNPQEYHILEEDIQRHTTAQYRSPEMIDIYRGFPIDEKSDIWALGVFLYKLCYYITPFEREGQLAILHAKYTFPARPDYSERLKRMIQATLREDPRNRPNVYQVMKEVCSMRGVDVPINDIYTEAMQKMQLKQQQQQTEQQQQQQQAQPQKLPVKPQPPVQTQGVHAVAPVQKEQPVIEITPMYRGRPKTANPVTQQSNSSVALNSINSSQPETSAVFSDPFALLDSGVRTGPASAVPSKGATPAPPDEISTRYPTVEELSKNLEQSGYFFDSPSITPITSRTGGHTPFEPIVATNVPTAAVPVSQSIAQAQQNILYQPQPQVPVQLPVQIATKTPTLQPKTAPASIPRLQYSSASPPPSKSNPLSKSAPSPKPSPNFNSSPNLLDSSSEDDDDDDGYHDPPLPARPVPRPRSTQPVQSRQRPVSMYQIQSASYSQEGNLIDTVPPGDRDELKAILTGLSQRTSTMVLDDDDDTHIDSNVQFLKSMEDDQAVSRKPSSHHHSRKPSGALSDWKSIRRSASAASRKSGELARKSSELSSKPMEPPAVPARKSIETTRPRKSMESVPRKSLDDDSVRRAMRRTGSGHNKKASMNSFKGMFKFDNNGSSKASRAEKERERERERDLELQYERERERERDRERELELERQRELERKEWSQRAKYTSSKYADSSDSLGISSDDDFKFPKPIQARVNSFLNQQLAESPPKRTAQGYGRFTDSPKVTTEGKSSSSNGTALSEPSPPSIPRRPQTVSVTRHTRQLSAISSASSSSEGKRPPPVKPIKPVHLRSRPSSRTNTLVSSSTQTEGVPNIQETDWEAKFNQKYPSLN